MYENELKQVNNMTKQEYNNYKEELKERGYKFVGKAYRSKERLCKAIDEYQKTNKMLN